VTVAAGSLDGQTTNPAAEARLLRDAASRESLGDYEGAEGLLRVVLRDNPASTGAIFALERIFRTQGRIGELLPLLDAFKARAPDASTPRYLKLRVLAEVDSLSALEQEAEQWMGREPRSPGPYREAARAYERALGAERALDVLRRGLRSVDDPATLELDLGDLLVRTGDLREAATAWSRAIGEEGEQTAAVTRRVSQLEGGRPELVGHLLGLLERSPATPARLQAGARIAIQSGLEGRARTLAQRVLPSLPQRPRRTFLTEMAQLAEERQAPVVALWAYEALRESARPGGERRTLDQHIAALAMALGDTGRALAVRERLVAAAPPGSVERRAALVSLVRLAASIDPEEAKEHLATFLSENPDAQEADELAAAVASRFHARGDPETAELVLAGVDGPVSALEGAYLRLSDEDPASARPVFLGVVGRLPPGQVTRVLELADLLGRLTVASRRVVAEAALMEHHGDPGGALERIRQGRVGLPESDQPALLAFGARIGDDASRPVQAASLRRQLVTGFPQAPESAEATLALARHLAATEEGTQEAIGLLEELILASPENPVVPYARLELERLRGPRSPGARG
jgi:tetratricopeptide (TPR) repeat protein